MDIRTSKTDRHKPGTGGENDSKNKSSSQEKGFLDSLFSVFASDSAPEADTDENGSEYPDFKTRISKNPALLRVWKIARAIFFIILVSYIAYQIYFSFLAGVKTEMVMTATVIDTIDVKSGVSIRDEKIISTNQSGIIVSSIESGGKVSKGETVARVFNSIDAAQAYERIGEIDRLLERFDDMSTAAEESSSNIASTQKQINDRLLQLSRNIYSGELVKAEKMGDDILYLLNKQQIATGLADNFDNRTGELSAERSKLLGMYKDSPASLLSPRSGYYISKVDGYENVLSTDILETLTPAKLDELLMHKQTDQSGWIVGKIADDYIWYIACDVRAVDAPRVKEGNTYEILFPYSESDSINAKLKYINQDEGAERAMLVFECTNMASELSEIRSQPMTIVISSHTGLELDRSCLVDLPEEEYQKARMERFNDYNRKRADNNQPKLTEDQIDEMPEETIRGVYVLWGNEVRLRPVIVLYEKGDKVICMQFEQEKENWLKLYDKVVTKTKGLYDGKIINGSGNNI